MATLQRLQESLDLLERFMPGDACSSPDAESIWISFTIRADLIREGAGHHAEYVRARLERILQDAGMLDGAFTSTH